MAAPAVFDLTISGDYDLDASVAQAARAAFVDAGGKERGTLDLAFLLEGSWSPVGVRITQDARGLSAQIYANPHRIGQDVVRTQLERILSLDADGVAFAAVAARDPVLEAARQREPGLRPILFPSPYQAAARAIIGHQLAVRQAARIAGRIAADHGTAIDIAGHAVHAFPAPDRLAGLPAIPGLAGRKVEQLRALGRAAAADDRTLPDAAALRAMPWDVAMDRLQRLSGIGPFSAELILLRGAGHPDAFPCQEPSLHRAMAAAYGLGSEADLAILGGIAERWRPFRTWAGFLLRAGFQARRI